MSSIKVTVSLIEALAILREGDAEGWRASELTNAFNALDAAGVFRAIDDETVYDSDGNGNPREQ